MPDNSLILFDSSTGSILSIGVLVALAALTAYLYRTFFSDVHKDEEERDQERDRTRRRTVALEELAPFECLPQELAWKILDFVPDEVLNLRATSSTMRYCVDNYALKRFDNFVQHYSVSKGDEKGFWGTRHIIIQCEVAEKMAKIFELGLALRKFSLPKIEISRGNVNNGVKHYAWEASENDGSMLTILSNCLGKQIDCVTISILDFRPERILNSIVFLDGCISKISILQVVCPVLSENIVHASTAYMNLYKVDQLSYEYEQVDTKCDVRIFVGVSKYVRAMRIHQKPGDWPLRDVHGDSRTNWATVILAIFQIGMVDKLWITTQMYPEYLAIKNTTRLILCLPSPDKKVWLEAHYVDSDNDIMLGITRFGHIVTFEKEQRPPGCNTDTYAMSIKHESRLNEKFEIHHMPQYRCCCTRC